MSVSSMNAQALQVFVTFPTRESAEDVAQGLVNERLAACVQILGPVKSIYRWQGQVESADEWLCLIKTSQVVFADVVSFVKSRHPYEVPEIVAVPICAGIPSYLQWLFESLRG
ncbi:MAG: divalent-cation tolerance protein CutA [Thermogutta sp.]